MRNLFILLISLFSITTFAQNSRNLYLSDLSFIYDHLKKSASYKTQKEAHSAVKRKYHELKSYIEKNDLTEIDFYIKAYELVDILKDNHNSIIGNTEWYTFNDLKNEEVVSKIKEKNNYFPKSHINLDSLESELKKKNIDDFEGVYYCQNIFKIAILKNINGLYQGIILETKIPSWERGETILYLKPKTNKQFRMFIGGFIDKRLSSITTYFDQGTFRSYNLTKWPDAQKFYTVAYPNEKYVFKNDSIAYLKLGTFYASNEILKLSNDFYNTIKDSLTAPQLIVDLRNNGGGGDRNSKQYLNLLKKYKGKIYILTNYYTGSNAEQFLVKILKIKKDIILLGDRTSGVLSYGHNYDKPIETPSKIFKIQFTDLKNAWRNYIKYEDIGIQPHVYLQHNSDWVDEVIQRYKN